MPQESRDWQVVKALTPDRYLERSKVSRMRGLIEGIFWSPGRESQVAKANAEANYTYEEFVQWVRDRIVITALRTGSLV